MKPRTKLKKGDFIVCGVAVLTNDRSYNGVAMISQDLLDILVCPVCKKPLVLKENGESLKCGECRRIYPIQDDIPILLVDAATIDAA
jgi:uncharacterized protein YbaR (Trm112 family)